MSKKNIKHLTVGPIATNCWIYPMDGKDAAVIDPGDEEGMIISTLKKLGLIPRYILLTHGHFDHIAAVPGLAAAFPVRPQIAIHRLDSEYLGPGAYAVHTASLKAAMGGNALTEEFMLSGMRNLPPADILLEEGSEIGPFTVLHLKGHSSGSVAFWDKDEGSLFSGDTLFQGTYGRTDLPGGNEQEIYASLRRLLAMDGNIRVYPGHGSVTTIGSEAAGLGKNFF